MDLPPSAIEAIQKEFAEAGRDWVEQFPKLLSSYLSRWDLSITGTAKGGLPINLVYFVENASGIALVLKMGHPHPEQKTEIIALKSYAQQEVPVVKLLDSEAVGYGYLMPRLTPGTTLREKIREPDVIKAALRLHKLMPIPSSNSDLPHFRTDWMSKAFHMYRKGGKQDDRFLGYLDKAERLYDQYCSGPDCLLHGDLHHENILLHDGNWMAIDPKGVMGPAILESGRFLHNFLKDEMVGEASRKDILRSRTQLAEQVLGVSSEALTAITFIDAALGTCWTLNSGNDGAEGFLILAALDDLIKDDLTKNGLMKD